MVTQHGILLHLCVISHPCLDTRSKEVATISYTPHTIKVLVSGRFMPFCIAADFGTQLIVQWRKQHSHLNCPFHCSVHSAFLWSPIFMPTVSLLVIPAVKHSVLLQLKSGTSSLPYLQVHSPLQPLPRVIGFRYSVFISQSRNNLFMMLDIPNQHLPMYPLAK